jgi:hypothetical protein
LRQIRAIGRRRLGTAFGQELPVANGCCLTTDKTGSISTCRYIRPAICAALRREISMDLLVDAFDSTPTNVEMNALARQLKKSHLVGIITDNKRDRIERLRATQGLDQVFQPIVVPPTLDARKKTSKSFMWLWRKLALMQASPNSWTTRVPIWWRPHLPACTQSTSMMRRMMCRRCVDALKNDRHRCTSGLLSLYRGAVLRQASLAFGRAHVEIR